MPLSIALLGPFWATVDDDSMAESRAKRTEALLAYLIAESAQPHRREQLVGLLFPEMPDDQARTNLRQTLARLRRAIKDKKADPPYLLITRESAQFNTDSNYSLDLADFERLLDGCPHHAGHRDSRCAECMSQSAEAVSLYRGPFLDGFFLEDSAAFDEWILGHRQRLQQAALIALKQLSGYHESRGYYNQAAKYARQQIAIEPWQEEAHRQLMRVLAYQGRRDTALRQYEILSQLLDEELGIEPMPETESLRRRLIGIDEQRPHRLPQRDISFVGRTAELGQLSQHLIDPQQRLLVLVGAGGAGKTALAVEAGWRAVSRYLGPFMHGVYFVPLATVPAEAAGGKRLSNLIVTAVAEALDFAFSGPKDPQSQLLNYLQDKSLLLILDNFEHLLYVGRDFLLALMHQTTSPKLLVTSRSRLNLTEEWILEVDGLPYPHSNGRAGISVQADEYEALDLFVRRARRLMNDFGLTPDDDGPCPERIVAQICRLVQGLPLGIELAASWVRFLSCREIAIEISRSLDFLKSSEYDLPVRHRSLRAVFDTSWSLLSDVEKRLFAQLSVFAGPFDRHAAAAVAGASLPQLADLVDHSLLHRQMYSQTTGSYFEILEVLRQFAAEQLALAPQQYSVVEDRVAALSESVGDRHTQYYLQFLKDRLEDLRGQQQMEASNEIALNMANVRAAWDRAADRGDARALGKSLGTLSLFFYMRSWFAEGEERFGMAADRLTPTRNEEESEMVWGQLIAQQGWFAFLLGRHKAGQRLLQRSVETLRKYATKDRQASDSLAIALDFLAVVNYTLGDYETAYRLVQEGLSRSQEAGDIYNVAVARNILSQICYLQGHYEAARAHCEESLIHNRALKNPWSLGFSLTNVGRVAFAAGDYGNAEEQFREALAIRKSLGDKRGQALCLMYLGDTAMAKNEEAQAEEAYQETLTIFQEIGARTGMATAWTRLGHVARHRGAVGKARENYRQGLRLARKAQATPRMLDAVAGMAWLVADDAPEKAAQIALLVTKHPASSDSSHSTATELLDKLRVVSAGDGADRPEPELSEKLAKTVDDLLAETGKVSEKA